MLDMLEESVRGSVYASFLGNQMKDDPVFREAKSEMEPALI